MIFFYKESKSKIKKTSFGGEVLVGTRFSDFFNK